MKDVAGPYHPLPDVMPVRSLAGKQEALIQDSSDEEDEHDRVKDRRAKQKSKSSGGRKPYSQKSDDSDNNTSRRKKTSKPQVTFSEPDVVPETPVETRSDIHRRLCQHHSHCPHIPVYVSGTKLFGSV